MSSSSSSEKRREHSHGRQAREFTPTQSAAVERIRRCKATAYYEILSVSASASDSEIKKAYHKLSLQTHPDKNGAPGADEAFKLVSKAFQILSDPQKRRIFDQTGSDPETRATASPGGGGNPFRAHAGSPFEGGEISPEDLFNMFFSGGGMGGGGIFGDMGGGGGFAFGGPGIRVHQFGGGIPRQRRGPRNAATDTPAEPMNLTKIFWQLLPLLIFCFLPLLSSLFGGSESGSRGPSFSMDPVAPFTALRYTPTHHIPYYVDPMEVKDLPRRDLSNFEKRAETNIVSGWNYACRREESDREHEIQSSMGFFFTDQERLQRAKRRVMPNCRKLEDLGVRRRGREY